MEIYITYEDLTWIDLFSDIYMETDNKNIIHTPRLDSISIRENHLFLKNLSAESEDQVWSSTYTYIVPDTCPKYILDVLDFCRDLFRYTLKNKTPPNNVFIETTAAINTISIIKSKIVAPPKPEQINQEEFAFFD